MNSSDPHHHQQQQQQSHLTLKRPRSDAAASHSVPRLMLSVKERLRLQEEERSGDQTDSTEGRVVDLDAGQDEEAMAGLEKRWDRLNRYHGVGGNQHNLIRDERDDTRKTELYVDGQMAQPPFFFTGNDFPPFSSSSSSSNGSTDEDANKTIAALWQSSAQMDIILPVVSTSCSLAVQATKGSAMLAELKRTMQREAANREAGDISRSGLATLLRGDDGGQQNSGRQQRNAIDGPGVSAEQEERDELEALQRRVRVEREKLDQLQKPHTVDNNNNNKDDNRVGGKNEQNDDGITKEAKSSGIEAEAEVEEARKRQRQQAEDRQRRKLERSAQIAEDEARMQTAEATEEEEERRARMRETRAQLPIHAAREDLLRCIAENAITVVVGETGSGKTTQLVQYLYERGYANDGMVIGCTQPRRLAAIGVARRVSEEMGCALGSTVGYAIHLDDMTSEATRIKFMTDGVLLREIAKDPLVGRYGVLILDEAHERSVDTDVLMGVLKMAIRRGRADLKLIVTSATMDVEKFSRYFGGAPSFTIPGRTYEVTMQYSPSPVTDYVADAVFRVCQLHLQTPTEGKHDILVFMTGRDDVYGTCELIRRRLEELSPAHARTLVVLPCMSEASSLTVGADAPCGVLDAAPPGMRKCVVATNVAETSLTIDGVRYVVDCGFMKTNVYRPKIGMNTLQRYPVSQAQAGQRAGRAGRTVAGVCFRLYTEEQHSGEMLANSVPEIQRCSVDSVVLLLKSIGVERIAAFAFMDAPPAANIRNSMWRLWVLGLLDDRGAITAAGRQALEFPLAPSLAKLLVESTRIGCSLEVARIVSVMAADPKGLFELPKGREEAAQQHHGRFHARDSDHLTLLNVLTQFVDNGRSRVWAQDHFVHYGTLLRACEVFEQLLDRLRRLRLPIVSCGAAGVDRVRFCLARAFCLQAAQRSGRNWSEYRPVLNAGVVCHLHPTSAVCGGAEMPPYLIYNDLLLASKEYMVLVTAVEPEWLVDAARGVFGLRGEDGEEVRVECQLTMPPAPEEVAEAEATSATGGVASPPLLPSSSLPSLPSGARAPAQETGKKSKFGLVGKKRANI